MPKPDATAHRTRAAAYEPAGPAHEFLACGWDVIAFLASPKASYITGAVIAAEGGRTAV